MITSPAKGLHRLTWFVALLLLLIAAILAAPFLFTTRFVNVALNRLLAANHPSVGRATLSLSGNLVLRDLVLRDTRAMSGRSLITAREIDVAFGWRELLARRLREILVIDAVVYARTSGQSQLSLLDLLAPISSAKPSPGASPLWINQIDLHGIVHCEALRGLAAATGDFPLAVQIGMSGDRMSPSRRFRLALGDTTRLSGHSLKHSNAATTPARNADQNFGLLTEIESRPVNGITRVTIDRLAARRFAFTVDAAALREFMPMLPEELRGPIETGVSELLASGVLDLPSRSAGKRLSGNVAFTALRIHARGDSQATKAGFDDLSGAMEIDTSLPPGPGTSITISQMRVRDAQASLDARTLRRYLTKLPPEIQGHVHGGIGNLSLSAKLERAPNGTHLAGKLAFTHFRLDLPAGSQSMLSASDLTGATSFDTLIPPGPGSFLSIEELHAMNAAGSIDADSLRKYVAKLPIGMHGPVTASLQALDLSGTIGSPAKHAVRFSGSIRVQDFTCHSSTGVNGSFELDRMTAAARIDSPPRWDPSALTVRDGELHWSAFKYGDNSVNDLGASWRIEDSMLIVDRLTAQMLAGRITGTPALNLVTYAMPHCDLQISRVDMHAALTNIVPERLDAEGTASGSIHLGVSKEGELSGKVDLAFDGPGTLKIGQIEELKQKLAGTFGADMANLAMHDLEHYPFKEGSLQLQSAGENSELKIKFIRQPRRVADQTPPRKQIINGHDVWVGSLVVPTIDMTIPISGKSLAKILSMAGGFHPRVQATQL